MTSREWLRCALPHPASHTDGMGRERDAERDEALGRWATSDRRLIRRMLALTPEERLRGLARAAAFFAAARRA